MRIETFLICFSLISCGQSSQNRNDELITSLDTTIEHHLITMNTGMDSANQEIYDFMKVVIANQNLNLSYGLSLDPEPGCDLSNNDSKFLNTLLIEAPKQTQPNDTGDWRNIIISVSSFEPKKCLTSKDIKLMLEEKQKLSSFKWDNSRLGFDLTNRNNWYCFSIPLFSTDKKKAVIMIRDLCKGLCGTGSTILFTKEKEKWISESCGQWVH